ncbi:hypothetical protein BO71DRAFT_400290 [Aspergillus ellipticus CBS 707.79]|uniref:Uncharacterized protein n=1 Tax=Aspergillus ellipticus CBS 707.79 TaxID=1448320 RepID=A0A319DEW3_9EURO|nr:hypothetical protein BO71DRAFT_400290 [Aspergillus ellipticus CBS 707.79]
MVAAPIPRENRIRIVLPDDKLADPSPRRWSPGTLIQESSPPLASGSGAIAAVLPWNGPKPLYYFAYVSDAPWGSVKQ